MKLFSACQRQFPHQTYFPSPSWVLTAKAPRNAGSCSNPQSHNMSHAYFRTRYYSASGGRARRVSRFKGLAIKRKLIANEIFSFIIYDSLFHTGMMSNTKRQYLKGSHGTLGSCCLPLTLNFTRLVAHELPATPKPTNLPYQQRPNRKMERPHLLLDVDLSHRDGRCNSLTHIKAQRPVP